MVEWICLIENEFLYDTLQYIFFCDEIFLTYSYYDFPVILKEHFSK